MDLLSLIIDDMRFEGVVFDASPLATHWHAPRPSPGRAAFHVLTQGQVRLTRPGHEPLPLQPGDLVMLPGGADHGLEPLGDGTQPQMISGHARFDVHMGAPLVSALPPLMHVRGQGEAPPPWLAIGLQFLAQELAFPRPGQQAIVNRLGDILFMECLRDHVRSLAAESGNWLAAFKDRALSAALVCMHREPAHPWTVPELAREACLSRSAFADRFTAVVGDPPLTYLTRHRMRLAARQLGRSQAPVGRVADQVGYASEAAFSQAFKREYGLSPSAWRRQHASAGKTSPAIVTP